MRLSSRASTALVAGISVLSTIVLLYVSGYLHAGAATSMAEARPRLRSSDMSMSANDVQSAIRFADEVAKRVEERLAGHISAKVGFAAPPPPPLQHGQQPHQQPPQLAPPIGNHVDMSLPTQPEKAGPVVIFIDDFKRQNAMYGGNPSRWIAGAKDCANARPCVLTSDSDKQQSADGVLKSIFQATTALQGNTAALQRFSPTQKSFVLWHEPGAQALERPQVRQAFDYTITYTLTSSVPLPYACDWTDRIMAMPPKIPVNDRKLVAAFLSAHCENNGRKNYVSQLMDHVRVDSHGGCLHNMPEPATRASHDWEATKIETLRGYKFAIAMENSNEMGYITEKVWHCFLSGAIPIYKGSDELFKYVPRSSVINVADFSSPKELALFLRKVDEDAELYAGFFKHDWSLLRDIHDRYCKNKFFCRMCELSQ